MVVVPSGLLIVPFILIVLNLALKQAVAQLPLLVNVQRARDVGLVKINLKHLMDAIITEMLLLMASEHPKNKICVFFCLLPPSTKRQSVGWSLVPLWVPSVSVLTWSNLGSGMRYEKKQFKSNRFFCHF